MKKKTIVLLIGTHAVVALLSAILVRPRDRSPQSPDQPEIIALAPWGGHNALDHGMPIAEFRKWLTVHGSAWGTSRLMTMEKRYSVFLVNRTDQQAEGITVSDLSAILDVIDKDSLDVHDEGLLSVDARGTTVRVSLGSTTHSVGGEWRELQFRKDDGKWVLAKEEHWIS